MNASRTARRWHLWLGWAAAIPLLLWTISGLWMVARPIEEVRGEHLRARPPALVVPPVLTPPVGLGLKTLSIEPRPGDAVWVATFADGRARAADLRTGRWLPPLSREAGRAAARAAYLAPAPVTAVTPTAADSPPIDLRRPRPTWRVEFSDGARVYVDRDTGSVLAIRTRQWRWFDFMWGLHILDPGGREDTSHPALIAAAAVSLAAVLFGVVLLPLATRWRRKRGR